MSPSHVHDGLALGLRLFLAALAAENAVYADHRAVGRDVARHHGVGADGRAAADAHRAQDFRRSEEHTSELQSPCNLVCRLLLEKKKHKVHTAPHATSRSLPVDHANIAS